MTDTTPPYRTKKRFGQHFLHERKYIDDILAAAAIGPTESVLEIGPGLGALTDHLLKLTDRLDVIELDRDLIERLQQRSEPNLHLHQGDALALDWDEILAGPPYVFVANLPYNISSQILFKLIDHRSLFSRAVLMFQKEVGDRICAKPSTRSYGILSVLCQFYFDVASVAVLPPGAFKPPPKVDSMVVSFEPLEQPRYPVEDDLFFRRVVKAAFRQRRKTLRNSLKSDGFEGEEIDRACHDCGIDPARRGETLQLKEFAALANRLVNGLSSTE
ncbi:MAG: ribosomal RNA small subunit methyltransferase A [Desulfuromonas sp.]|nr:MAG: ribosomal RNA small subunit methyltransferase A [Desulfuromonas sp.]